MSGNALTGRRIIMLCFNSEPSPRLWNLYRLFRGMGGSVRFVTWQRVPNDGGRDPPDPGRTVVRLQAPVESWRLIMSMPCYWRKVRGILRELLAEGGQQQTVIVATHIFHLPLALRFRNVVWLYDSGEYYAWDLARYFGLLARVVYPFLYRVEGRILVRMRGIMAIDSKEGWFERQLLRFNPSVKVVPNLPAMADDVSPSSKSQFAMPYAGRRVICYVGGLLERKGLGIALQAVEILSRDIPDLLLLLIGSDRNRTPVAEQVAERGLEGHVQVFGAMPYRELLEQISMAEVGLALHQRDPLYEKVGAFNGRKVFTYMQAGLAVIAPAFGEMGTIVTEVGCGIRVDTENPIVVADGIRELLRDPDRLVRMRRNGRLAFETQYHWERAVETLEPWLAQCCSFPEA